MKTDTLLDYAAAAEWIGVPESMLRSWVQQRRIPHHRFGPRTVRFAPEDLERFVQGSKIEASGQQGAERG